MATRLAGPPGVATSFARDVEAEQLPRVLAVIVQMHDDGRAGLEFPLERYVELVDACNSRYGDGSFPQRNAVQKERDVRLGRAGRGEIEVRQRPGHARSRCGADQGRLRQ